MVTEVDEGTGLVKTCWANVRNRVMKVEPTFANIIDELNPDRSFPIYLAYFPYGELIGDIEHSFFPKQKNGVFKLSDPDSPQDLVKHLGYGINSLPMGMVLEKNIEWFIDLKNENISIPWVVYSPGTFFPFSRVLSKRNKHIYVPNNVLSTTSGSRSAFMLPNIGCATKHINLQRDFNVQSPPPKTMYEHWYIFREIISCNDIDCDWRSCLIYFSEKWVDKFHNDKAWLSLKLYLHEWAWRYTEYRRNNIYYDIAFSMIQKKRNLKPNPYLADTAKHLFAIASGVAPGYIPVCNNDALPLSALQKAFVESYDLKKYLPTIMQPVHHNFKNDTKPIYYSLQNPSTFVFSPKSRKISSTLFEIRELENIMRVFINELSKDNTMCSDTIVGEIAKYTEFKYFHNEFDRHRVIRPSTEMATLDERFHCNSTSNNNGASFASDAKFLRGCISIQTKS